MECHEVVQQHFILPRRNIRRQAKLFQEKVRQPYLFVIANKLVLGINTFRCIVV